MGAFLGSKDVATDGYSFCIDGAELLTPREYLKRAHDDYSKYGIVDTKTKLKGRRHHMCYRRKDACQE